MPTKCSVAPCTILITEAPPGTVKFNVPVPLMLPDVNDAEAGVAEIVTSPSATPDAAEIVPGAKPAAAVIVAV